MKVECRLSSGHLVGRVLVPDVLMEKRVPAVVFPERGIKAGFSSTIELVIAEWRDQVEGPARRIFKVRVAQLSRLRNIRGFEPEPLFDGFPLEYLKHQERLADLR